MGARGPLAKPESTRQGHRRGRELVVLDPAKTVAAPEPPKGLLKPARDLWDAFWRSSVAQAVDLDADYGRLERWIQAVDELHRIRGAIRERRVVTGSMGQPVVNPLITYAKDLEAIIQAAEKDFGMTPYARARLGLTEGEARLTAAQLNEMVRKQARTADDDDTEEWSDGFA